MTTLNVSVLWTTCPSKHFIFSIDLHCGPMKDVYTLAKEEKRGTEMFQDLLQIIKLLSFGACLGNQEMLFS